MIFPFGQRYPVTIKLPEQTGSVQVVLVCWTDQEAAQEMLNARPATLEELNERIKKIEAARPDTNAASAWLTFRTIAPPQKESRPAPAERKPGEQER